MKRGLEPGHGRGTILLSQVRRTREWEIKQSGSCFDTTIMTRIRMFKLTYLEISRDTPWAIAVRTISHRRFRKVRASSHTRSNCRLKASSVQLTTLKFALKVEF